MRVSRLVAGVLLSGLLSASAGAQPWVERSNAYTQKLLNVALRHDPEAASSQGLAAFDLQIAQPSYADELQARRESEAVLAELRQALASEGQPQVKQDLQILLSRSELALRSQEWQWKHVVVFRNASSYVFERIHDLLGDQVAAERRPAAVVRLRKYAGLEPGVRPIAELLKEKTEREMALPGAVFPSKNEIEVELGRNQNYLNGMRDLLDRYGLAEGQEPLARLSEQLQAYDSWVRATLLPHARADFRLPPEQYALNLEEYGIDLPPAQLVEQAHQAFTEIQAEMSALATRIAKRRGLSSSDYRAVMAALKQEQLSGEAILPFYQQRLKAIEELIRQHELLTLPKRPAVIQLATAAETASQPAPHMQPPPFLHNTGQRGAFVLPLVIPGGARYDDFTFDAAAWTLTAHEARPGHELQFDSMLEQGVSLARALYAFNSTNVEGWGLYSEWMMLPYMPEEGQLVSLDYRLLRAARAFLDPELQSGKITPEEAFRVLQQDVVCSRAMATQEVERYTYRGPGQACSYFYGYTQLRALRRDTEAKLGSRFHAKAFHDFILAQGLLPTGLLRKAVDEEFIPSQQASR